LRERVQKLREPAEEEAEVITGGGEDGG